MCIVRMQWLIVLSPGFKNKHGAIQQTEVEDRHINLTAVSYSAIVYSGRLGVNNGARAKDYTCKDSPALQTLRSTSRLCLTARGNLCTSLERLAHSGAI